MDIKGVPGYNNAQGPRPGGGPTEPLRSSASTNQDEGDGYSSFIDSSMTYRVDETVDQIHMFLMDKETGDLIRPLTPEETLNAINRFQQLNKKFLDERA